MIDFQARIDGNLKQLAKRIAASAIYTVEVIGWWNLGSVWDGDKLSIKAKYKNIEYSMTFDLAGRAIDAALLEQLHNEVTAWFTAIKEGATA